MIIQERLEKINRLSLKSGSHLPNSTFCVMEAVAYVAGEQWSDHPECACPVISTFLRSWNDSLPTDGDRDRLLKNLVPKLVGTKSTLAVEYRRVIMSADWFIRFHLPAWLRLAGLTKQADLITVFPEITDFRKCPSLQPALKAVRKDAFAARDAAWAAAGDAARAAAWAAARAAAGDAAWDAAWDAAGAAAGDAAWAAAGDAARAAAGDAAWAAAGDVARAAAGDAAWDAAWAAAGDAAWAAAWDAAWAAAGDAARAAAWEKFKPTVDELQQSALQLVERMIELKEVA